MCSILRCIWYVLAIFLKYKVIQSRHKNKPWWQIVMNQWLHFVQIVKVSVQFSIVYRFLWFECHKRYKQKTSTTTTTRTVHLKFVVNFARKQLFFSTHPLEPINQPSAQNGGSDANIKRDEEKNEFSLFKWLFWKSIVPTSKVLTKFVFGLTEKKICFVHVNKCSNVYIKFISKLWRMYIYVAKREIWQCVWFILDVLYLILNATCRFVMFQWFKFDNLL